MDQPQQICQLGQRRDYSQQQLTIHLTIRLLQLMGKHMKPADFIRPYLSPLENRIKRMRERKWIIRAVLRRR